MNIINFTPVSAFVGGSLIGFAAFLFFVFNGRIAGVSSIASDSIIKNENRFDNILFLLGLIIGPIIYSLLGNQIESFLTNSLPLLICPIDTIVFVTVVPILAPITIGISLLSPINPPPAMPTISDVVVEEL